MLFVLFRVISWIMVFGSQGKMIHETTRKYTHEGAGTITVIGATAGAVAGFIIGKFGTKRILLYRAK
jgi:hypothetical protein